MGSSSWIVWAQPITCSSVLSYLIITDSYLSLGLQASRQSFLPPTHSAFLLTKPNSSLPLFRSLPSSAPSRRAENSELEGGEH